MVRVRGLRAVDVVQHPPQAVCLRHRKLVEDLHGKQPTRPHVCGRVDALEANLLPAVARLHKLVVRPQLLPDLPQQVRLRFGIKGLRTLHVQSSDFVGDRLKVSRAMASRAQGGEAAHHGAREIERVRDALRWWNSGTECLRTRRQGPGRLDALREGQCVWEDETCGVLG